MFDFPDLLCVATVLFKNRLIPFYSSGLTGTHHAKKTKKLIAYSLDIHYNTAAALLALKIDGNSLLKLSRTQILLLGYFLYENRRNDSFSLNSKQ